MARRITLIVEDNAPLKSDAWYSVRVTGIEVLKREGKLIVGLQHIEGGHEGRCHRVELRLPVRPYGLTAEFLRACGFPVAVRTEIRPEDARERIISVRFEGTAGSPSVRGFRNVTEEESP
ncbi:MAG: hypothetical protein AABZ47_16115 [Planctomycetota bacterium]